MRAHHIGYLVKDLAASEREFAALGWEVEREAAYDHIRRARIAFLTDGAWRVELIEPDGEESPLHPLLRHYRNTPYHICYEVRGMAGAAAELESRGYRVLREPEAAPCLGGRAVEFLTHPHIGIVELVEEDAENGGEA